MCSELLRPSQLINSNLAASALCDVTHHHFSRIKSHSLIRLVPVVASCKPEQGPNRAENEMCALLWSTLINVQLFDLGQTVLVATKCL